MFNLGMGEMVFVGLLALIFIGPRRLPEMATGLGKIIRDIRKATWDIRSEIHIDDEIRGPLEELRDAATLSPAELDRQDRLRREAEARSAAATEIPPPDAQGRHTNAGENAAAVRTVWQAPTEVGNPAAATPEAAAESGGAPASPSSSPAAATQLGLAPPPGAVPAAPRAGSDRPGLPPPLPPDARRPPGSGTRKP